MYNYAGDTTSDIAHRHLELVIKLLEEDADAILKFMASNGLVANQKKLCSLVPFREYVDNMSTISQDCWKRMLMQFLNSWHQMA